MNTAVVLIVGVSLIFVGSVGLGWSLNDLARQARERKNLGG